jgi:hypothetical protein
MKCHDKNTEQKNEEDLETLNRFLGTTESYQLSSILDFARENGATIEVREYAYGVSYDNNGKKHHKSYPIIRDENGNVTNGDEIKGLHYYATFVAKINDKEFTTLGPAKRGKIKDGNIKKIENIDDLNGKCEFDGKKLTIEKGEVFKDQDKIPNGLSIDDFYNKVNGASITYDPEYPASRMRVVEVLEHSIQRKCCCG